MRRSGLFRAGERVGVAVSGGPDSIVLLDFMTRLSRKLGLTPVVVHFNHHLRGAESDGDELFVREHARELNLEFICGEADVRALARERGGNLEATARDLRYRFFFSQFSQGRLDKVATAHTASDQAETVLLRVLRGTGTRGLGGIYPVLNGKVVRPFLNVTRPEIEAELARRGLRSRLDSSNLDSRLRRNKIRRDLLPQLKKDFNPEVISLLKELADRARDDEEVLEQLARERAHPWRAREGGEERIPFRPLVEFPPAIARRVLRQMVLAARGSLRGFSHRHIEALRRFVTHAQSGRRLVLPGGLGARKDFEWFILAPSLPGTGEAEYAYSVKLPGEIHVSALGVTFSFKIVGPEALRKAYNQPGMGGLDPLKLGGALTLRNWRAGDRFRPIGSQGAEKLKEFFRLRKIPFGQRKLWPVLVSGEEIVWVRGFPPASHAAASPEADRVLVIEEKTQAAG